MEEEKKEVKEQDTKVTEKVEKKATEPAEKKGKEKKNSKKGIIISIVIVIAALVIILAYMFLSTGSPKQSLEAMLSGLKSGNYSQEILDNLLKEDFDQEAQKLLFDKLEWKILNVKEEGNKATIEVEITNKDFKTIIGNYMQKIIKIAFSGKELNEAQMTEYLIEELNNNEIQKVTSNQSIVLEKKDGKWELAEENNFDNILLPGFREAINSFSN